MPPDARQALLMQHIKKLQRCRACPQMIGPVVVGHAVASPVMLVGQAPGDKEGVLGKPFAWTAGKTLFKWFSSIGLEEEAFRNKIYMAAVCRCFPGKNPKGGDRVPDTDEIRNCSRWLERELQLLQPELIIPVGKLAIGQFMPVDKLDRIIGTRHTRAVAGRNFEFIPLPHPSGASTWHRTEPGKTLLEKSLKLIRRHPAFLRLLEGEPGKSRK
jgi:uracil-DNA glycosylase